MKHFKPTLISLGLAIVVMVAMEAEAGKIKKPPKGSRTEKPEELSKPQRFERNPNMVFVSGVLNQDPLVGWTIGDIPLYLSKKCVISMAGAEEGSLVENREAVVMGVRLSDGISAWSVQVSADQFGMELIPTIKPNMEPGDNPAVGRYTGPID